ncbi:ArnT family glycosyltransferase [Stenomitos frigidus]|uniref:Phospholipid carrier-dependent glycosyltransferase n=1 Tax=Stenomitos frigidus ULC18 TaxID=2107698 RepID=A0A2T1E6G5_9CYAN|nr:glycosyltransferase family 39 protein [Stenomitos frigidus]PSB28321.1 phospholipid carrier-dependent glycosyltransferase [Stenomitos frigidus ULC18]
MLRKPLPWNNPSHSSIVALWIDRLWMLGLFVTAGILLGLNLGNLPLRDWDEGTVAQVARDIWRSPPGSLVWLHPTLAGEPYFNKPPLMHWLMALTFRFGGVNEWMARLPGATLTALSVPLLYGIGRHLFSQRTPAIFTALVYLTLLPVVRHGRLAMLDGAVLYFFLLLIVCLLRTRRDLRWGLGVGIAFGLLCLTKGIVALLLGAIAIAFILWDTPRLLTSGYVWVGVLLGSAPVVAWYWAQWLYYGQPFLTIGLFSQSLDRVVVPVEGNRGEPWYYLLEILKYSAPWLLFFPQGLKLAWENRNLSWAKLILVWASGYLLVISFMSTKLPWYVLPVYPAFAIAVGAYLSDVWQPSDVLWLHQPKRRRYPIAWIAILSLLAIAGWVSSFYFSILSPQPQPGLPVILGAVALTLTAAIVLLWRSDSQFMLVLFWGMYVSLLLFVASPYWLWELEESYPVKPVAALVRQNTPPDATVWTLYPYGRPSLNFYSDRRMIQSAANSNQLPAAFQDYWQHDPHPYLLVEQATLTKLALPFVKPLGTVENWVLLTRQAAILESENARTNLPLK